MRARETERRRTLQLRHNTEHGITATGISKSVNDLVERVTAPVRASTKFDKHPAHMDPEELAAEIKRLEKSMYALAKELEFEKAAELRDQLRLVNQAALGLEPQTSLPTMRKRDSKTGRRHHRPGSSRR